MCPIAWPIFAVSKTAKNKLIDLCSNVLELLEKCTIMEKQLKEVTHSNTNPRSGSCFYYYFVVVVFYINLLTHRSAIKAGPPSQRTLWETCRAVPSQVSKGQTT